ncbi:speckle-type POZ protein B-like [Leptopilina heterotoma]|uniref:speckle-type POZ protein B-like n=1 Tax=Leptopilina heterotoma TaxID=63436 RepID=UPI001CA82D5F|nr:speckle-type POZ protein B-like [Leptopilina heterotoma]
MDGNNVNIISTFGKVNETKNYFSNLKFHHYELRWTIENFELLCKSFTTIESPKFPSKEETNYQWFLQLQPTELKQENEDEFHIYLKNTNDSEARYTVTILFSNYITQRGFKRSRISNSNSIHWSITGSELRKRFGNVALKNVLVICKLKVFDSLTTVEKEPLIKRRKCNNDLMENMTSLLGNENFKDVRFKVEDKEFTAHKAILVIQSPVFAAMFNSKMSEELTSIVEIKDIKPKTFQQMLNFIYNVEIKDLNELALELFHVAWRYKLEELMANCISKLLENLSLETVIKTLEMADFYSLSDLKSKCLNFLLKEWDVIKETEELKKLIEDEPSLVTEVVNIPKMLINKKI